MAATVANAINVVSKAADSAIDIYAKLRNSFRLSDDIRKKSKECQSEMKKLTFKKFDEKYSCKSVEDLPAGEFEDFVTKRLKKRLNLPENVVESLLDGQYVGENKENVKEFHFQDGTGNIHHGRFITVKRNDKMDIAYAVYTLSFELAEKEIEGGAYEWWLWVVPVWSATKKKEVQTLTEDEKGKFSGWCEVKLYDFVVQECQK